jgi:hypothetical protein
MSKNKQNNKRSDQQQVDVFEHNSPEDTKDNIVTIEKEEREERERLDETIRLANDPVDW